VVVFDYICYIFVTSVIYIFLLHMPHFYYICFIFVDFRTRLKTRKPALLRPQTRLAKLNTFQPKKYHDTFLAEMILFWLK